MTMIVTPNSHAVCGALRAVNIDPEARMAAWWAELPEEIKKQWMRWGKVEISLPLQPWGNMADADRKAILTVMQKVCAIYRGSQLDRRWHVVAAVINEGE